MGKEEVPYGHVQDDKIILNAWGGNPDRMIGEIKDGDQQSSVQYFIDRFGELEQKITKLKKRIDEAVNQGSFYMQLVHLKDSLASHDGLGDYLSIDESLTKEISRLEDIIVKNRQKNSEIKKALLLELEEAVEMVSWHEATEKIKDIRLRWIKTGAPTEEEAEELESTFQHQIQEFFDRKKAFYEDRAKLSTHYEKIYNELINEATSLNDAYGKDRFEKINKLKQAWKDNGPVPAHIYQPLYDQFNKLIKPPKKHTQKPDQLLNNILDQINSGELDFPTAKELQKRLKAIKAFDPQSKKLRSEANQKLNKIIEISFIDQLLRKRHRDLNNKPLDEQKQLKSGIIRELIDRDKKELELISENLEKISSKDPGILRMMQQKVHFQEQKILIKQSILDELKR